MYFNQSLNLISHNDNPIIRIADDGAIIDAKPNVVCKIIAIWLTLSANDDFKYAPIKLTVYWYSTVNNEVNKPEIVVNTTLNLSLKLMNQSTIVVTIGYITVNSSTR